MRKFLYLNKKKNGVFVCKKSGKDVIKFPKLHHVISLLSLKMKSAKK